MSAPPTTPTPAPPTRRDAIDPREVRDDRGTPTHINKLVLGSCPDPNAREVKSIIARLRARQSVTWKMRYLHSMAMMMFIAMIPVSVAGLNLLNGGSKA